MADSNMDKCWECNEIKKSRNVVSRVRVMWTNVGGNAVGVNGQIP